VREETDCSLWVVQQLKVVGCCPGDQALIFRRCCSITPIDVLAVEVASILTGA